jgi:hypothetical protein
MAKQGITASPIPPINCQYAKANNSEAHEQFFARVTPSQLRIVRDGAGDGAQKQIPIFNSFLSACLNQANKGEQ